MMEFVIRASANPHECMPTSNRLRGRNAGLSLLFDLPEALVAGRTWSQRESRGTDDEKGSESVPEVPHTVTV